MSNSNPTPNPLMYINAVSCVSVLISTQTRVLYAIYSVYSGKSSICWCLLLRSESFPGVCGVVLECNNKEYVMSDDKLTPEFEAIKSVILSMKHAQEYGMLSEVLWTTCRILGITQEKMAKAIAAAEMEWDL